MKNQFPGYFKPTKAALGQLWKTALFVFDANILLGFYRYSDKTRTEFLQVLEQIKSRCWLPHQAAQEYFNNRLSVIGQQEDAYSETIKALKDIEERFKSPHQHPFLPHNLLTKFSEHFEEVAAELAKSKQSHSKRINDDDILIEIEGLFRGRVGEPFSEEEQADLFKEGEKRYEKKLPPGYKDSKKADELEIGRKYGDLILWKEILRKATTQKGGVIFISDDKKEDWWLQFKGKTLGPRPELIKEFARACGGQFHMYASDKFIEFAGEQLGRKPSPDAVSEMRELKRIDATERERMELFRIKHRSWDNNDQKLELERLHYAERLARTQLERSLLQDARDQQLLSVAKGDLNAINQQQDELSVLNQKLLRLEIEEGELRRLINSIGTRDALSEDDRRARQIAWVRRRESEQAREREWEKERELDRAIESRWKRDAEKNARELRREPEA